jgi:hypothetical protein
LNKINNYKNITGGNNDIIINFKLSYNDELYYEDNNINNFNNYIIDDLKNKLNYNMINLNNIEKFFTNYKDNIKITYNSYLKYYYDKINHNKDKLNNIYYFYINVLKNNNCFINKIKYNYTLNRYIINITLSSIIKLLLYYEII